MPEMMPQSSAPPAPDVTSLLLLVAVLALLACTGYVIYLGCSSFGAATFFRAIYSTDERIPQIAASVLALI